MCLKKNINIYEYISVYDLSLLLNIKVNNIIKKILSYGIKVTINSKLNKELTLLICDDLGYKVNFIKSDDTKKKEYKKESIINIDRPPIVTIFGHVDHGKTSLIDYIRKTNTTSKEYGNITQRMSIYNVEIKKDKRMLLIDTPGHYSFVSMRYWGLKLTDIAIIIISSESGIMEQTLESINNVKSENIPIIFVFSKIDKKDSNVNKIKEQLSNLNILVEDWGGVYLSQEVSVKTGYGINELLDKIFIISKKLKLKTSINTLSSGTIIEATLDKREGYIVKLLVKKGILKIGDYIISGIYYGKIKKIYNDNNKKFNKIYPYYPVYVVGFNGAPNIGEKFEILNKEKIKEISTKKKILIREYNIKIKNLLKKRHEEKKNVFNVIIKGDVNGSIDVISDELHNLSSKELFINIINKSVGNITESDISLANISNSIIIGFNVKIIINKKKSINKNIYNNIYIFNLIYDIIIFFKKKIIKKKDNPKKILGSAKVIKVFPNKIFGCIVLSGIINLYNKIIILRNEKIIYDGEILSIKRFNKNVNKIKKGYDFGIIIKNFNNLKQNDIIQSYIVN
ncbi:MAG: translation initiation factor IF-2 [Candidatus Shikimatogenerans bostrichidophilus]|nr:MAG: translation initiation factor IF-2 [Candidatus Shikimatogenerans bostrichidophilus]